MLLPVALEPRQLAEALDLLLLLPALAQSQLEEALVRLEPLLEVVLDNVPPPVVLALLLVNSLSSKLLEQLEDSELSLPELASAKERRLAALETLRFAWLKASTATVLLAPLAALVLLALDSVVAKLLLVLDSDKALRLEALDKAPLPAVSEALAPAMVFKYVYKSDNSAFRWRGWLLDLVKLDD